MTRQKKASDAIGGVGCLIIFLYLFLTFFLAMPYYHSRYIHTKGFGAWSTTGGFRATVDAFGWPLHTVNLLRTLMEPRTISEDELQTLSRTLSEDLENIQHFLLSKTADESAARLLNDGAPYTLIAPETMREIKQLRREALEHAKLVRDDVLERMVAGLSIAFREKYVRGIDLWVRSIETGDVQGLMISASLHNEWIAWLEEHESEFLD
jgi:hypothetical protein